MLFRSHSASEETILCRALDNRIRMLARGNARRLAMLDRLAQISRNVEETHTPDDLAAEAEVRQLVAQLTPLQRTICRELMDGQSALQIASLTGRHYTTVCRHVRHIRDAFADRGIDPWSA